MRLESLALLVVLSIAIHFLSATGLRVTISAVPNVTSSSTQLLRTSFIVIPHVHIANPLTHKRYDLLDTEVRGYHQKSFITRLNEHIRPTRRDGGDGKWVAFRRFKRAHIGGISLEQYLAGGLKNLKNNKPNIATESQNAAEKSSVETKRVVPFGKKPNSKSLKVGNTYRASNTEKWLQKKGLFKDNLNKPPVTFDEKNMFGPEGLDALSSLMNSEFERELEDNIGDGESEEVIAEQVTEEEEEELECATTPEEIPDQAVVSANDRRELERLLLRLVPFEPLGDPPAPDVAGDILEGYRRPRLAVGLHDDHVDCTLVDDKYHHILSFASTRSSISLRSILPRIWSAKLCRYSVDGRSIEAAFEVGKLCGRIARSKGICKVSFDRRRHEYSGRVQAIAEGARVVGLDF